MVAVINCILTFDILANLYLRETCVYAKKGKKLNLR